MINQKLLVSGADYFADTYEINPYYTQKSIDIEKAKAENDLVFILVHCHDEEGVNECDPPAYLKEFCRAAIDAGAHAVFGGGVHILRGLELYRGKPIFYSLGDFIYQGPLVEYLPPDFMEKYGLDVDASAKEALWVRSKGGKVGLSTNEKNYLSVVPKLCFDDAGELTDLSMMPIRLTFMIGDEAADGLPYFAVGEEGEVRAAAGPNPTIIDLKGRRIHGVGIKTKVRKQTDIVLADQIVPLVQDLIDHAQPSGYIWKRMKDEWYVNYYAALEAAGCRRLTPYSCRHTTATALAVTKNIAPQTVRKVMRWSTARMLDRYAHPDQDDALAAVNTIHG